MKLLLIFFNKILFKLIPISMQLSVQLHSEQITWQKIKSTFFFRDMKRYILKSA